MAKSKAHTYKVGQIVCRVGKGIDARNRRLGVVEVDVPARDNRGRPRLGVRAWNVSSDGARGQKADKYTRPYVYLYEEIAPCR